MSHSIRFPPSRLKKCGCKKVHTSKDCAYQSSTLFTDGISLSPSGKLSSSWTRCARRMGSSSARNCEALKREPVRTHTHKVSKTGAISIKTKPILTCGGLLAELDHLSQAHASCREAGVVPDGVHQLVGLLPRHLGDLGRGQLVQERELEGVREECTMEGNVLEKKGRSR